MKHAWLALLVVESLFQCVPPIWFIFTFIFTYHAIALWYTISRLHPKLLSAIKRMNYLFLELGQSYISFLTIMPATDNVFNCSSTHILSKKSCQTPNLHYKTSASLVNLESSASRLQLTGHGDISFYPVSNTRDSWKIHAIPRKRSQMSHPWLGNNLYSFSLKKIS